MAIGPVKFSGTFREVPSPADDPSEQSQPWPTLLIIAVIAAGLISPIICFAGGVAAYAFADRDQGMLLAGAGLVYVLATITFFSVA